MTEFNISRWYWRVLDRLPDAQVYSSESQIYVPLSDAGFQSWLARGNALASALTEADLVAYFGAAGSEDLRPAGVEEPAPVTTAQRFRQFDRLTALRPPAGTTVLPHAVTALALTTAASAANRLEVCPFVQEFDATITGVQVEVSTAVAASQFHVGLYRDNAGRPGTLIGSALFSGAATGFLRFDFATPFMLRANTRYWIAVHASGAIGFRAVATGALAPLGAALSSNTLFTALRATATFNGALPDPLPTLSPVSAAFPSVRFILG